jgi:hypothetical protein
MKSPSSSDPLSLVRFIGCGFLALSTVFLSELAFPPQFTNPTWEVSFVAVVLERTPLPLLGLAMVFWGGLESRRKWELPVLKMLSWSALVASILYMLLIPLGFSALSRLNSQNQAQLNAQYQQQMSQLDEAQLRLENATSQELDLLVKAFKQQDPTSTFTKPQDLKTKLYEEINATRQKADSIRANAQRSRNNGMLKSAVKSTVLSLLSAFLFFYTWYLTLWARQTKGQSKKRSR